MSREELEVERSFAWLGEGEGEDLWVFGEGVGECGRDEEALGGEGGAEVGLVGV